MDPLDSEILERAFETTWDTIKGTDQHFDAESDEELEAALRRELIARFNGISDPETLKDILWWPGAGYGFFLFKSCAVFRWGIGSFRKYVTFGADELRSGGILPFGFQSEAFAHSVYPKTHAAHEGILILRYMGFS